MFITSEKLKCKKFSSFQWLLVIFKSYSHSMALSQTMTYRAIIIVRQRAACVKLRTIFDRILFYYFCS